MSITITPAIRNLYSADAVMSLGAGLLCSIGAASLAPMLGLPHGLLFWAGLFLLPWSAILFAISRRAEASRLLLLDVVAVNALWVMASAVILTLGVVSPNALGIAFILAQALAVAGLTGLQFASIRRASVVAA